MNNILCPSTYCCDVNNKYIAQTNSFKLCSLISVNTHVKFGNTVNDKD